MYIVATVYLYAKEAAAFFCVLTKLNHTAHVDTDCLSDPNKLSSSSCGAYNYNGRVVAKTVVVDKPYIWTFFPVASGPTETPLVRAASDQITAN